MMTLESNKNIFKKFIFYFSLINWNQMESKLLNNKFDYIETNNLKIN